MPNRSGRALDDFDDACEPLLGDGALERLVAEVRTRVESTVGVDGASVRVFGAGSELVASHGPGGDQTLPPLAVGMVVEGGQMVGEFVAHLSAGADLRAVQRSLSELADAVAPSVALVAGHELVTRAADQAVTALRAGPDLVSVAVGIVMVERGVGADAARAVIEEDARVRGTTLVGYCQRLVAGWGSPQGSGGQVPATD